MNVDVARVSVGVRFHPAHARRRPEFDSVRVTGIEPGAHCARLSSRHFIIRKARIAGGLGPISGHAQYRAQQVRLVTIEDLYDLAT